MGSSMEAAIVLSICLFIVFMLIAKALPFSKAVNDEARHFKIIIDQQQKAEKLYKKESEVFSFSQISGESRFPLTNSQKAVEIVRLAKDLRNLKERRKTESADISLPSMEDLIKPQPKETLPGLPYAPSYPQLPVPESTVPALP